MQQTRLDRDWSSAHVHARPDGSPVTSARLRPNRRADPECTLSTVAPIGAHLVIQATIAQARRLHDKLGRVLGEGGKGEVT
jgi:hypothetical protein